MKKTKPKNDQLKGYLTKIKYNLKNELLHITYGFTSMQFNVSVELTAKPWDMKNPSNDEILEELLGKKGFVALQYQSHYSSPIEWPENINTHRELQHYCDQNGIWLGYLVSIRIIVEKSN